MKLPWNTAVVWDEPGWAGGSAPLFGLGRRERLKKTLEASGIERIVWPEELWDRDAGLVLAVSSTAVFDRRVLSWFGSHLQGHGGSVLCSGDGSRLPVFFSAPGSEFPARTLAFESAAGQLAGRRLEAPAGHVCIIVRPDSGPADNGRGQWLLSSKPKERWHLRGVRRCLFPLTALLARRGVHPNTVTRASFAVALAGCALFVFGGYVGTVAGAVTLYAAWLLDCLDGALSRLTFQSSAAGAKLDTDLGRIAYAATAASVAWVAFVRPGDWVQASIAAVCFAVSGILSIVAGLRADGLPVERRPVALWSARTAMDHVLHRDNTLVLVVSAAAGRPGLFLWFLIAVLNVSWLLDSAVVLAVRGHRANVATAS